MSILETLGILVHQTAFFGLTVGNYAMIAVAAGVSWQFLVFDFI